MQKQNRKGKGERMSKERHLKEQVLIIRIKKLDGAIVCMELRKTYMINMSCF